ncbi:uncharacterized protein LOC110031179 isoform X3 [Phalaenopsis equestris]|uniref:uncharacterized protein LOC110031179 isoform X3 n=1 Tax=Phalaenopsis equestris TaxID=78828 RepID=UPI0009E40F40|nr:uncharacterized protein LOC110031179 isoform X3 [Phalaenopsis equestris]
MVAVLNGITPKPVVLFPSPLSTGCLSVSSLFSSRNAISGNSPKWKILRQELKCQGRFSCFFADGNKQFTFTLLLGALG